ncbi:hypothetical protein [Flavobacterium branchiophilum]|uniref:hypothetical protein n=1 Tax=Flavobacterium branchiophilum TaxID=55197 RepID=UPI0003178703|nr:hypothetical protein [Flavobacterium branchiophilum]
MHFFGKYRIINNHPHHNPKWQPSPDSSGILFVFSIKTKRYSEWRELPLRENAKCGGS